ncbi:ubiquitin-like protein Pup [Bifidobacterium samirii]|uniref:Prokaryotic ubiquitin-like protein Pup n=1 Tax=Bifidobacterium samirii TaxID=2306974 RepID=A0A430FPE7_9BIFI|nr:ubiquitin-like protein Pup [Bifidobacterium samirii]RSX54701.1 Prokaryotic ubiquitin-like protein Pup [Bifidobacterium samirii]
MPQEFERAQAAQTAADLTEETAAAQSAPAVQETDDILDSVLDDIASVLETNAETYVNSFVQKGGE